MDVNTNNIYRDVTIDQLSEANVGETKKIAGWIENIRDHGGVSFIDLRDMYGVMQVVMRDTSLLEGLSKEDCISVEGPIEHRDEETYNPKIPTGTIELEAKEVKVLGKTYRQLPFEVMTSKETREDVRLKYRYLDLRNTKVKDNMIFRSNVISYLRQKMTEMGFFVHHHLKEQEITLFQVENLKENSMHYHRHHSSISSYLWCQDLINISRLHLALEMKMQELTDLLENSIS
jgi:aspartyl-tRNA synthetase